MARPLGRAGFDGTTGRSDHGGRRTHIIQLLRDSKEPVSVVDVADQVGIHVNTARFHLESLVDAGMAERAQQSRVTPGRPKVLYSGTLPNQTHERAQGYRLLAEALTAALSEHLPNARQVLYDVGRSWGHILTDAPAPGEELTDVEASERLVAKLDALWFAPATEDSRIDVQADDHRPHVLVLHNCPFGTTAKTSPEMVCALHSGLINGTLAELGSHERATRLAPWALEHGCVAYLEHVDPRDYDDSTPVPLDLPIAFGASKRRRAPEEHPDAEDAHPEDAHPHGTPSSGADA